ncbi:RNA lariat debranching enzyme [Aspergillus lucknowensis]|uniref:Lariat debranching enzyme, C-terminal domain-containing protein n=1 Tax=Aspergillus lucknowensis TaxID=176173 RepID=A0ABR4M2L0_9EURO
MSDSGSPSFRVAVEGCGHGCLHDIYASVEKAATLKGWDGVDLLIIGGDFQAVRNSNDMACMSVPPKYKELGDFHEYYSGKRKAPYLTIFIGGNHEASNYLFELYYGGWVAPNIYYMGAANVLRCGPLRIAAMSGIWKGYDYRNPHSERLPYNRDDIYNIYHIRELDVRKLLQIRTQVDVGLSHDWPNKVEYSGDWQRLFHMKKGFRDDSQSNKLGSQAARYVLDRLRPAYWFSAHLHVKFVALVQHATEENEVKHRFGLDGASFTSMILGEEDEANQSVGLQVNENTPISSAQESEVAEAAPDQRKPDDTPGKLSAWNNFHQVAAKNEAEENSRFLSEQAKNPGNASLDVRHNLTWRKVDFDEDGIGRRLAGVERSGHPREAKKQKIQHEKQPVKNSDEIDLDLDSDSDQNSQEPAQPSVPKPITEETAPLPSVSQSVQSDVSEDLRKQLPSSFAAPQRKPHVAAVNDPFPEAITNKTTSFLALDKCLPNREFLQLLEFDVISDTHGAQTERPFRLHYDKEWLAITRVFADDLKLGDPSARPSPDKGDAVYRPLIEKEEEWVEENVVKPGKLAVPDNFTLTAPVYDPAVPITTEEQPPEYNNPQTASFCDLVSIGNKFYLTEEERDARIAAGPRPCDNPNGMSRRGRGGFGGRGRGYGRGGYGYGRGGRR